jgi:hypothetical protein
MSGRVVKRAFKYRFCPSDQQTQELSRTFGCVPKVYNLSVEARTTAWYGEQRRGRQSAEHTRSAFGWRVLACGDGAGPARAEAHAGSRR